MLSSRNSPKVLKKKPLAKKQWKAAPSKPSVTKSKSVARSRKPAALPAEVVLQTLKDHYPDAHCALDYETPFQLLIATILSAQCTDERVNIVTKVLFRQFPDAHKMAKASLPQLEELVRSTGFFKNKARSLKSCSMTLVEKFGGEVPKDMDELTALAGVGRKTANVVLGNAFGIPSGVVVDTHVTRLSQRFGWTQDENAVKIERVLEKMIPVEDWILVSHLLISHGRALCKARGPKCGECFLADRCPAKQ